MKRIWKRTTTAVEIAEIPADVLAAIRQHAERVGVGDPLANVTRACLTTSESLERRRFRKPPQPVNTHMLIAEPLLLIVVAEGGKLVASFLRLDEIELKEYAPVLVEDEGLELIGMAVGATERAMRFLPLDHGPAGVEFRAELLERRA
jgi:hypothetical protein